MVGMAPTPHPRDLLMAMLLLLRLVRLFLAVWERKFSSEALDTHYDNIATKKGLQDCEGICPSAFFERQSSHDRPAAVETEPESTVGTAELVRIAPWNGHRSAYTSSWDDGNDAEVTFVPTVLAHYGVRGTFFLTPFFLDDPLDDPTPSQLVDKWNIARRLYRRGGHEVGEHSVGHDHFDRGGASAEGAAEENFGNCSDRLDREFPETNGTTRVFAWPFGGHSPGNGAFKVAEREYLASRTIHCSSIRWDHSMDPSTRTALPGCELSRSNMAGCASLPLSHDDEHAALSVVERAHRDRAWVIGFGHGVQSCAHENWTDTYVPGRGEVLSEAIRHDVTGETVECRHGWNPLPKRLVEGHARHIAEMRDTRDGLAGAGATCQARLVRPNESDPKSVCDASNGGTNAAGTRFRRCGIPMRGFVRQRRSSCHQRAMWGWAPSARSGGKPPARWTDRGPWAQTRGRARRSCGPCFQREVGSHSSGAQLCTPHAEAHLTKNTPHCKLQRTTPPGHPFLVVHTTSTSGCSEMFTCGRARVCVFLALRPKHMHMLCLRSE